VATLAFFSRVMGHSARVSPEEMTKRLNGILVKGESVRAGFQVIRDYFAFTNVRLIFVDHQGVTGKKVSYHSIPYRSITQYKLETAGRFDLEAELKIWVSGLPQPYVKTLSRGVDIRAIQRGLTSFVVFGPQGSMADDDQKP